MFAYLIHFAFKATAAYIISYTLGQFKVEKKKCLSFLKFFFCFKIKLFKKS